MTTDRKIPKFSDIQKARRIIRRHLARTPLHNYPMLDQLFDARVWVKHENYQPIGAFKIRGGINLVSQLSEKEKEAGVVTASTGNHGQSIACAARLFGIKAVIVVPEKANPVKIEAIRSYGAEVVFHGKDFDDSKAHAEEFAKEKGMRYVSSGDEPLLIAGVGTMTLEILEEQPDVDKIFVAVGGGSGAAGTCIAAKATNASIQVIGVQSAQAPSAYLTWKAKEAREAPMQTIAEGLATRAPFMLPQQILWQHLDDFLLVEDDELKKAVNIYLQKAKTLAEPAGAASLAGALKVKDQLKGKTIALILSGGNITPRQLLDYLEA